MNYDFLMMLAFKGMVFVVLPLSVIIFLYGVFNRKSDAAAFRFSRVLLGCAIFAALVSLFNLKAMAWVEGVQRAIMTAIENKESWHPEEHIPGPLLAVSAYWPILLFVAFVLIFWPSKSKKEEKST